MLKHRNNIIDEPSLQLKQNKLRLAEGNSPFLEPSASAQSDDLIKATHRCILWPEGVFWGDGLDIANEGQTISLMPRLALGGMPGQEKLHN